MSSFDNLSANQTATKVTRTSAKIRDDKSPQQNNRSSPLVLQSTRKIETAVFIEPDQKSSPEVFTASRSYGNVSEQNLNKQLNSDSATTSADFTNSRSVEKVVNCDDLYGNLSFEIANSNLCDDENDEYTKTVDDSPIDYNSDSSQSELSALNLAKLFRNSPVKKKTTKTSNYTVKSQLSSQPAMSRLLSSQSDGRDCEFFCNVGHHHKLEDDLITLQNKLYSLQCSKVSSNL